MADETTPTATPDPAPAPQAPPDLSLSDHESTFGSPWQAPTPPEEVLPSEPGASEPASRRGRRHSAKNGARAADVPRIRELTRKNAELQQQLEARSVAVSAPVAEPPAPAPAAPAAEPPKPAPAPAPLPAAATSVPRPQPPLGQTFPDYASWLTLEGNAEKDYDAYTDARADWRWAVNAAQQRQADHAQSRDRSMREQMTAARQAHADFDAKALEPTLPITPVMHHALMESDRGAEILYHLGLNPALAREIALNSYQSGPDAMPPMKLYLESLVPAARPAGAPTGSPLALVPRPPAPAPPNPVRTGVLTRGDEPPDPAKESIRDHERFYGTPASRRARG